MVANALPTPVAAKVADISHQDLRQLVRRDLMLFPGTPGVNENSPRYFETLGIYEASIMGALHQDLGLSWPNAHQVFQSFMGFSPESESRFVKYIAVDPKLQDMFRGHMDRDVTEKVSGTSLNILKEQRDTATPVFLVYYFGSSGDVNTITAVGYTGPWDYLHPSLPFAIEKVQSEGVHAAGVLNLTSLLIRTDQKLADLEV